jgi:hypothetical protein
MTGDCVPSDAACTAASTSETHLNLRESRALPPRRFRGTERRRLAARRSSATLPSHHAPRAIDDGGRPGAPYRRFSCALKT